MMTKDKRFYKNFFSLYWVLVLHNIIVLAVNLADNIMIGAYSETALSGVAAVNQIQFVFQQIIMGCGDALVMVGSQYWGQKKTNEIQRITGCALLFGGVAAVLLFALACVMPHKMVGLFTNTPAIIQEGVAYLSVIKYTYILFAVTNILLAALRTVETVKIGFYVSLSTLVINCTLNYMFIGGNWGAPALGARGAAIGTLAARMVELLIVLFFVRFRDSKLKMRLRVCGRPSKTLFLDYCGVARSVVLVSAMFGVSTALQTVILGHMQDSAIAANAVSTSLYQTLKVAMVGASSAAAVIIGKTVGSGDMPKIKEYTKTLQVLFVAIGIVTSIALFFLRIPILQMYDLTAETKALANAFILVLCITGFGTAYEMPTLCGIVRGGGDAKFILINDLISIWGIVLPLSFFAAFYCKLSPVIVVFCLNADQLFKCIPAVIKVNRYTWGLKSLRGKVEF